MTGFGQIDDGQAAMAERDAAWLIGPDIASVRAAVNESCGHIMNALEIRRAHVRGFEPASNAAHGISR